MKVYRKKLKFIENHQYSDLHSGMALPSSGKKRGQRRKRYERPFKKMVRQHYKREIRKEMREIE